MAVDLHTSSLPYFLPDDDHQKDNQNQNQNDDDFISDLTHRMACFLLPDDDSFQFSTISSHSHNLQGSSAGSSHESSPPTTPQERCWNNNMKLNETGNSNSNSKHNLVSPLENNQTSNTGLYSYQSLIQEQIRAIELSGVKQEQVVAPSPKAKPAAPRRKNQGQTYEAKQGNSPNGRRARQARPSLQQVGAGMRALFLDGPGSRGGTGVFLPRAGATTPSESTNKQGKGCSTVLIPARVVQALQLHFDQVAATSGPKAAGFPPLHDVLVSNRDGMYSLQKPQSRKSPASIQNDTILPQEWTY